MRSRLLIPAVVVVAGLFLGACSSDHDGMDGMNADGSGSMDMGPMDSSGSGSTTTLNIPEGADFNAIDVSFAQGMIPHHGQAVQMADMALATSTNPEILALAEQIKAAQSPEIEQMTTWLNDWGQTVPDPNAMMDDNMDHSGGMMMSGMMSAADMARLENATGADFDGATPEVLARVECERRSHRVLDGSCGGPPAQASQVFDVRVEPRHDFFCDSELFRGHVCRFRGRYSHWAMFFGVRQFDAADVALPHHTASYVEGRYHRVGEVLQRYSQRGKHAGGSPRVSLT